MTTVSHALSGQGRVDPSTRARVLKAATAMGYSPNRNAQNLRLGKTRTLALLLPAAPSSEDTNVLLAADFYVRLANASARAAFSRDHALILLPPSEPSVGLTASSVDGAVVVDPVRDDPRLLALDAEGKPTVTIERDPSRLDDPWWVAPDNRASARLALDHLAGAGATRVALLSAQVDAGWVVENEQAYAAWCEDRNQQPLIARASLKDIVGSTDRAVGDLLAQRHAPDAIFCIAELFGPPALKAVQARGISIPGQMLMASGHDSHAAEISDPPLTAIDARPDAQATAAIELLMARLAGEAPTRQTIRGVLNIRESSTRTAPTSSRRG